MAFTFPTATNTFIPNAAATHNMVVNFSRQPSKFSLAKWAQYTPVTKTQGVFYEINVEQAGRVGDQFMWQFGTDAPDQRGNEESFQTRLYACQRYAPGGRIDELAAEQGDFDLLAAHSAIYAQQTMTNRTNVCVAGAVDTANYLAANVLTVSSITGNTGKWDLSTTARNDIKRSFFAGYDRIRLSTLGAVQAQDVMVVMSPGCARKIALAQEVTDYIKGSPDAKQMLTEGLGRNVAYGLPDALFGFDLVIENAVKVTNRKGAAKVQADVLADATPFMCSRPGGLMGVDGAPSFSTHQVFLKDELVVETKHDRDNKCHKLRCIDTFAYALASNLSGVLFQAAVN